jgi:hypothetical protein
MKKRADAYVRVSKEDPKDEKWSIATQLERISSRLFFYVVTQGRNVALAEGNPA